MKKLMTSMIILLPLLILAILLVSGAILSLVTHIYVESVEFVGNGALFLRMEDEAAPPSKQLEVNVLPLEAKNRDLVFTVEDETIATVDENGVVTAKFYGETYITVTSAENKAASARRAVVVTDDSVHKLELNGFGPDLYEGQTQEFSVTVYPKEAADKTVTWSSSDEKILRIGANGVATAVGAGCATVTATSQENPKAQISAVICCHKKLTDLEVDQTLVVTSLKESKFPDVKPIPGDADVTLAYRTDDPSVATVDGSGRITFRKEGRAVVTVTATDFGGKTVEKQKEYTSTDGYFLPPLFAQKEFTVDYDEYQNEPLPIPFADGLKDSYRKFVRATYTVENVLAFDETEKSFRFANPMPAGTKTLKAEITALVYSTEQRAPVEYEDYFYLTVLRNAQKISVSYPETADAAAITIAEKTISFSANGKGEGAAGVTVFPENHTDELAYSLLRGEDVAELSGEGTLTFRRAGEAAVRILCTAEKSVTAEKTVRVIYAPIGAGEKKIAVTNGQTEDKLLLLTMDSETDKQTGVLYFTEPAGATVEYTAEADAVELRTENGSRRIVPIRGGFATVKINVTCEGSATAYSVRVYVDCPVSADDLTVSLGGSPCADRFGTTAKRLEYLFAVREQNASMAGKRLYVSRPGKRDEGEEGGLSHAGTIAFGAEYATLGVTFGVEYGDAAKKFGADEERLAEAVRTVTILRDAERVSVSYRGTDEPASIRTSKKSLTFTTEQDGGTALVNVAVQPANHTNTFRYSIVEGEENAAMTRQGVLTFLKAGEVTVKIELCAADGHTTAEKEILVAYAPLGAAEKEIEVSDAEPDPRLLLMMSGTESRDTGVIRFTEPAGAAVEYRVEAGGEEVVSLEQRDGVRRIVPRQGGFATVKITVTPSADGGEKAYTVRVYVDRAVEADDFEISFCGTPCGESFGTALEQVPYAAEIRGGEGCMAGKRIFASYGARRFVGTEDVLSGMIGFSKSLGELAVTFGAEYGEEAAAFGAREGLSSVTRLLLRNAEEVSAVYRGVQTVKVMTQSDTVTFAEGRSGAAFVSVTVSPAVHTDTLSYALEDESGIAALSNGKLTFSEAGAVTVRLLLQRDGEVTLQKAVTVIYEPLGKNENAEIDPGRTEPLKGLLPMGEGKELVFCFTEPEGSAVDYRVTEGEDTVIRLVNRGGVWHIVPVGGGFAAVQITVALSGEARTGGRREYTLETYVDAPVKADDFAISFNGTPCTDRFRTSLDRVNYSVTVADRQGSTAGKKLYIMAGETRREAEAGVLTLTDSLALTGDSLAVTFGVDYGENAAAFSPRGGLSSVTRTVTTSRGKLDEPPAVTYRGGTLAEDGNAIEFSDIGDKIVLTVENSFSPADFDFPNNRPAIGSTVYVKASVSEDGGTITLEALKPCRGQEMALAIANRTFPLSVTVHALANEISVTCGETELNDPQYETLLDALSFHVTIGREDGLPIDDTEIEYSLDGAVWQKADGAGNVKADIAALEGGLLRFRSADEGASCEIGIEKVLLEAFGLKFSVRNFEGADAVFGEIASVTGTEELSFALPADMQGFVTVKVLPERANLLGGFGTTEAEFKSIVSIDLGDAEAWTADYVAGAGQIVLGNMQGEFRHTVRIMCGGKTVSAEFSRIVLERIEFTGFDSNNTVNGGDVYKGYQQVRVFAKQSVYDGKEVDYFRMPVRAWNKLTEEPTEADRVSLSKLAWSFTRCHGAEGTAVTVQSGKTVKYLGTEYEVADLGDGRYGLKKADGTIVVGTDGKYVAGQPRVTWADAFSEAEEGFVRVYFGDVLGLSGTDVQNDYFGNFGERENWSMPSEAEMYAADGTRIEPSEGAFSYLRLEGGDGAKDSKANAHFNFNVLEGADLYNIFDATGYFDASRRQVVLHNDLYAQEELKGSLAAEAAENDWILDREVSGQDDSRMTKDLIYGNGCQVNLKTLSDAVKDSQLYQGAANTGAATHFGTLCNVTLKGNNPHDDIEPKKDRLFFVIAGAYYSDIQYYTKMNLAKAGTIKNTVLRYVASAAVQLYNGDDSAFLENVVIAECLKGLTFENSQLGKDEVKQMYSFKGFFDVLNYYNANSLKAAVAKLENGSLVAELFPFFVDSYFPNDYAEWFGKTTGYEGFDKLEGKYINIAIYSSRGKTYLGATPLRYWDGSGYGITDPANEAYKLTIALEANFIGWTYKNTIAVDGGRKNGSTFERDMSKLFDAGDRIRLLCQYTDHGVKNTEHIQWHMNKVHRDTSLIEDWEDDHIAALKASLLHAKNGSWDGVWPDGSTLGEALPSPVAAMYRLLSETVVPSKRTC